MVLYIFSCILLILFIFYLYIRLKYKFWAIQPVFHFYDFHYWFRNVGIINTELPKKNKYTNFKNIETVEVEKLSNKQLKQFLFIIQHYYLKNGENIYNPQKENVIPYFTQHSHKSFFTFYYEDNLLEDLSTKTIIPDKKLIAVINSRPLHVSIHKNNKIQFDLYYVDFLCVDKMHRRKNIAPQIIQTHEYNQAHRNKNISVSLFKREGELTGIVPLCLYKTYGFDMKKWSAPSSFSSSSNISILSGDQQNLYYINEFIKETNKKWDILIMPSVANLIELTKTKNIFIKCIMMDGEIQSVYFFRDTCTYVKQQEKITCCFASIQGDISNELFIHGFKLSLASILKDNIFHFLSIEDISDNNSIIQNLLIKSHPIIVSPTAYFFYNFAYETFHSNKTLILN